MTLIFEESEAHLLVLLRTFRFEASIVAGPHGGQPAFRPWSVEEVVENADGITEEDLVELIEVLDEKGQLMVIPSQTITYSIQDSYLRNGTNHRDHARVCQATNR